MTSVDAGLDHRLIASLVGWVGQGRCFEAERGARALLNEHPRSGMLWKVLSVALLRQGKDALAALRRTAELLPQDAEAHGNLGAALRDRGSWTEALASLERALALDPRQLDALLDAAQATRSLGRIDESIAFYERALRQSPDRVETLNDLGNALLEARRYELAADRYRRALELAPATALIHCNLAGALLQGGHVDRALQSIRHALALDPALSPAHNTRGLILAALGRAAEALAAFRQAVSLDARNPDALTNLANLLRDLGQHAEALPAYARAVELEPRRADSRCNLGSALYESRRYGPASGEFAAALALRPGHAAAHLGLAMVLRAQGVHAEAAAHCDAALAGDPGCAAACVLLGELQADRGRFAEASGSFRRARDLDPDFAPAYSSIAAHRRMTTDDAEWLDRVRALLGRRLPRTHDTSLRYALGKYFDDVGRYPEAFAQYRLANEQAKGLSKPYDPEGTTRRVDALIRDVDHAFVARARDSASPSETPVFVIGMPRSGTSLVEQILASHPQAIGAGEVVFWEAVFDAHVAARDANIPAVDAHVAARGANMPAVDAHRALPAARAAAGDDRRHAARWVAEAAPAYLGRLARAGVATRVVDKMPANFLYAGLIHATFPHARIIHVRRHPVDTCLSLYFQNYIGASPYSSDLDHLAFFHGEYRRIMRHWRALLPASTLLEVSYEALVEDQEGETRRMLEFIGLPWDPRCLDFHRTDRVVVTASKWQVRQKMYAGSIGRWKHYERFLGPLRQLPSI